MYSEKRKDRKKAWQKDFRKSLAVLFFLLLAGVLVVALSGTDHDRQCRQPDIPSTRIFRPIESRHYGTPAGAPFSRLSGGQSAKTYWTNDTTPVDVMAALDGLEDPSAENLHRSMASIFPFFGQFVFNSFSLQIEDQSRPRVFSHLAEGFPGVHPSFAIVDEFGVQQINYLDPYLSNSATYGHTDVISDSLRMLDGSGRLKMGTSPHHDGSMLPLGDDGNFTAGDVRVRENLVLSALHTLFCREHNYWADRLASENPHWDEEELFHTARHIVIGEVQSIFYNEWLPALLGTRNLFNHPVCYRSHLRLTVRNELASSVLRMGHSLIPEILEARDVFANYVIPLLQVNLADAINQPLAQSSIYWNDIDTYLLGALYQEAELLDTVLVSSLFSPMNLGATDIARGRDHGLPSFQDVFEDVMGRPFRSIREDLTSNHALATGLEQTYDYGNDPIDLWVGVLAEDKQGNSMLGKIGRYLVAEQFIFSRNADPYYYEWDDVVSPWRNLIHATKFADVVRRNTNIEESLLQGRSFYH